MAQLQIHRRSARHRVPPDYTPRLRLKPKADSNGYLDGAWWPRSGKLTAELPDLLAVLTVRLGPIQRVVYDRTSWSRVPRRLTVGNHVIQLEAYPFELGNTMYVYGSSGMTVLHVIASTTSHDSAHTALMAVVAREPKTTLD